jgi:hypothetical protein
MVGTSLPRAAISNFSCHLPSGKIFKKATIAELFWVAGSVWAQEPTNEPGPAAWPGPEGCCPLGDDWASAEHPKAHAPITSRVFSAFDRTTHLTSDHCTCDRSSHRARRCRRIADNCILRTGHILPAMAWRGAALPLDKKCRCDGRA